MLCFEADCCPRGVLPPLFSFESVQPVAGIELYAGLGGLYGHADSARGGVCLCRKRVFAGIAFGEDVVVVISAPVYQLPVVVVDSRSDFEGFAKIHRSSGYRPYFARGNGFVIHRGKILGVYGYYMVGYLAASVAVEVEERVMRGIYYRGFVGECLVGYAHRVFIGEFVFDLDKEIAGESGFSVGGEIGELEGRFVCLSGIPYDTVIPYFAAMQCAVGIGGCYLIGLSVDVETAFSYAVAVTSYQCAQIGFGGVEVFCYAVVSEHYVAHFAFCVRHHKGDYYAAVIGYTDFRSVFIGQYV